MNDKTIKFSIKAEREMTDNKDNMLLKLYEIQKIRQSSSSVKERIKGVFK